MKIPPSLILVERLKKRPKHWGPGWDRSRNGWPTATGTQPFQEFRAAKGSTRRFALWHFFTVRYRAEPLFP